MIGAIPLYNRPIETLTKSELQPNGQLSDLVFYSPPYFKLERYSDSSTQSINQYPNLTSWLNHFFYKSIQQSYVALREGGIFSINIGRCGNIDLPLIFEQHMKTSSLLKQFVPIKQFFYGRPDYGASHVYIYQKAVSLTRSMPANAPNECSRSLLQLSITHQSPSFTVPSKPAASINNDSVLGKRPFTFFANSHDDTYTERESQLGLNNGNELNQSGAPSPH